MLFDGKPDEWSSSPVQSINHLRTRRNFLFKIPKSLPLSVYISISLYPKKKTLYKHILTILLLLQSQIFYVYILYVTWRTKIPNKSKRETYTKSSLMIRKLKNRYILLQASHSNGIERPLSSSSLLHSSPFVLAFSRARFLIPVKARRRGGRKMTVRSRIEE